MRRTLLLVDVREHGFTSAPKKMAPLLGHRTGSSPAGVNVTVRSQRLSPSCNHRFCTPGLLAPGYTDGGRPTND
jgi:hypothetical protein